MKSGGHSCHRDPAMVDSSYLFRFISHVEAACSVVRQIEVLIIISLLADCCFAMLCWTTVEKANVTGEKESLNLVTTNLIITI